MVAIKVEVHPVLAYACGRYLLALDALALLSVTVLGALPTAQNVYVHASRHRRQVTFARDAILSARPSACLPSLRQG